MSSSLLLILVCACSVAQTLIKKVFSDRCRGSSYLFNAISAAVAMCFFIATCEEFILTPTVVFFSVLFAAVYAGSLFTSIEVFSCGPFAISALLISYSLVLPALYGLFLGDPIKITLILGLVGFMISLFLVNYRKKGTAVDQKRVSVKWVILIILAFVSGGFCSIFQKMEQLTVGDPRYNNSFMIVALALSVVAFVMFSFFKSSKEERKITLKESGLVAAVCGACNGAVNLFVMMLNDKGFPASVMFPVISASGILIVFLASITVFKEKFTKRQLVGFFVGVSAVILLNL